MRNKCGDKEYCGCNKEKVLSYNGKINMDNMKILYEYVSERNKVFIKKESGQPKPWTDNEIIRTYSFTNLRREQDKTTKWLINNISNNLSMDLHDRFYNSLLFRMYNRIDTAEVLELNKPFMLDDNKINNLMNMRSCYTRAFRTLGLRRGLSRQYPFTHDRLLPIAFVSDLEVLHGCLVPRDILQAETAEDAYVWFSKINGVGPFFAYQFFVDMTYMRWFPFSENEFVVCGPGAIRGLSYLFPEDCDLTDSEKVFWLRNNIDEIFKEIDPSYDVYEFFKSCWCEDYDCCWNVMSLENVVCEFSKYMWPHVGGKIKRKYNPLDGALDRPDKNEE